MEPLPIIMNEVSKASGFAFPVFIVGLVAVTAAPHQILVVAHRSFFESTLKARERGRARFQISIIS
jgi:hypothetical protein